jgi:hypothetical protein
MARDKTLQELSPTYNKLIRNHRRFVDNYMIIGAETGTFNATEAYKRTFGEHKTKNSEYVSASQLLRSSKVQDAIQEIFASETSMLTKDRIVVDVNNLARITAKDGDKLRAYELLARVTGIIKEGGDTNIQINQITDLDEAKQRMADRRKAKRIKNIPNTSDTNELNTP